MNVEEYFEAVDRYFKDKTDRNNDALGRAMAELEHDPAGASYVHTICTTGTCGCHLKFESRHGKKESTTHVRRRQCHPS